MINLEYLQIFAYPPYQIKVTLGVGYNVDTQFWAVNSDVFYISRIFKYLYFYYLYNSINIFSVRIEVYIVFHYVISSHWVRYFVK